MTIGLVMTHLADRTKFWQEFHENRAFTQEFIAAAGNVGRLLASQAIEPEVALSSTVRYSTLTNRFAPFRTEFEEEKHWEGWPLGYTRESVRKLANTSGQLLLATTDGKVLSCAVALPADASYIPRGEIHIPTGDIQVEHSHLTRGLPFQSIRYRHLEEFMIDCQDPRAELRGRIAALATAYAVSPGGNTA